VRYYGTIRRRPTLPPPLILREKTMATTEPADPSVPSFERTENDLFIWFHGLKIAKRGYPGTPQANTWISLEPGWSVLDSPDGN
jgi:hypothetical protein